MGVDCAPTFFRRLFLHEKRGIGFGSLKYFFTNLNLKKQMLMLLEQMYLLVPGYALNLNSAELLNVA